MDGEKKKQKKKPVFAAVLGAARTSVLAYGCVTRCTSVACNVRWVLAHYYITTAIAGGPLLALARARARALALAGVRGTPLATTSTERSLMPTWRLSHASSGPSMVPPSRNVLLTG